MLCLCNNIWSFIKSEADEFNFWTFHVLKSFRISIQLFSGNKRSYFSLSKINLIVTVPPLSKNSPKFPLNNLILLQLHLAELQAIEPALSMNHTIFLKLILLQLHFPRPKTLWNFPWIPIGLSLATSYRISPIHKPYNFPEIN